MKIFKRIKSGKLKGYTIRVSKNGWYDLYSASGVSQLKVTNSIEEIEAIVKNLQGN